MQALRLRKQNALFRRVLDFRAGFQLPLRHLVPRLQLPDQERRRLVVTGNSRRRALGAEIRITVSAAVAAGIVREGLIKLEGLNFSKKFWAKDPTLWTKDPEHMEFIPKFLE